MKIVIDTDTGKLMVAGPQGVKELPLSSPAGCELLSQLAQAGRDSSPNDAGFTWAGQPVQEHPEALFRLQEAIHQVRPQILVRTGKATAGSLLYLAHVLRQFGGELVVSVDGDVPLDEHLSAAAIQLVRGDAAALEAIDKHPSGMPRTFVLIGASADKEELHRRIENYHPRLPMGSALLSMELLTYGELRAKHAAEAVAEFAMEHPEYRGEFLAGKANAGLVPLLIRLRD